MTSTPLAELQPSPSVALALLAPAVEAAADFARAARAPATQRAYRRAWSAWSAWCSERGGNPLPARPALVAAWIGELGTRGLSVATIEQNLAALALAHRLAREPSPTEDPAVREVLRGLRRRLGCASKRAKAAMLPEHLRGAVPALPSGPRGALARAVLLVGLASGCRRSELVALQVEDLEWSSEGVALTIRRSKTDQEGHGRQVGLPFGSSPELCPVRALRAWLEAAGSPSSGPVFRTVEGAEVLGRPLSDRAVARIVKRAAGAAGLDPSRFGGHSLRAGLATAAARAGVPEHVIQRQTGHASTAMLRRYIRAGSLYRENAAAAVL